MGLTYTDDGEKWRWLDSDDKEYVEYARSSKQHCIKPDVDEDLSYDEVEAASGNDDNGGDDDDDDEEDDDEGGEDDDEDDEDEYEDEYEDEDGNGSVGGDGDASDNGGACRDDCASGDTTHGNSADGEG